MRRYIDIVAEGSVMSFSTGKTAENTRIIAFRKGNAANRSNVEDIIEIKGHWTLEGFFDLLRQERDELGHEAHYFGSGQAFLEYEGDPEIEFKVEYFS